MERNFDIVSMNIAEKRPHLSSRRFLGEQQNENIGGWKRTRATMGCKSRREVRFDDWITVDERPLSRISPEGELNFRG